jgi:hypothetical protein
MQEYVNTRLLRNSVEDPNIIELSHHPDLTLEVLKKLHYSSWGFQGFHNHPNFTFQWVLEFPNKFWDWNRLSEKVDLETISKHSDFPWNWCLLTNRFQPKDILEYPQLPWDFSMFHVPKITEEHVRMFEEVQHLIPDWKWHYIAQSTSWSVFKKALHLPWLWFVGDIKIHTDEFLPEDVEIIRNLEILCNWIRLSIYVHIDINSRRPPIHLDPKQPKPYTLNFRLCTPSSSINRA